MRHPTLPIIKQHFQPSSPTSDCDADEAAEEEGAPDRPAFAAPPLCCCCGDAACGCWLWEDVLMSGRGCTFSTEPQLGKALIMVGGDAGALLADVLGWEAPARQKSRRAVSTQSDPIHITRDLPRLGHNAACYARQPEFHYVLGLYEAAGWPSLKCNLAKPKKQRRKQHGLHCQLMEKCPAS